MKKLRSIIVESSRDGKGYMIVKCPFCEREFPMFRSTLSLELEGSVLAEHCLENLIGLRRKIKMNTITKEIQSSFDLGQQFTMTDLYEMITLIEQDNETYQVAKKRLSEMFA